MSNQNPKILCAFPIFVPNEYFLNRGLESILSFVNYLKTLPGQTFLDIIYAGWCPNDEYWKIVESAIKDNIPQAKVFRLDKNYGKSTIVNRITQDYIKDNPDTQFLFTMDSDIKFILTEKFFFDRLLIAAKQISDASKRNFGLIALNQQEENCHWLHQMDQNFAYIINEVGITDEMVWSQRGDGIAGGCLFMNLKGFLAFGGYRFFNWPYGGDDAFVELDFRTRNFTTCIIKSLSITHPKTEANEKYNEWKHKVIVDYGKPFDEKIYLENVKSSEEFWKNNV